ncbi:MAG: DUF3592 domain-containing protein [Bdellovibrionales bacterium]|nr:DUF3592 domain-containing protein [Bdellovibrionales bacterium]
MKRRRKRDTKKGASLSFDGRAALYGALVLLFLGLGPLLSNFQRQAGTYEEKVSSTWRRVNGSVIDQQIGNVQNLGNQTWEVDQRSDIEYSDSNGNTYTHTVGDALPIGSSVELLYDPSNPRRVRLADNSSKEDIILLWFLELLSHVAALYFFVNFLAKVFFDKRDFLGSLLNLEL